MEERETPNLFVRLALSAVLCSAGLIAVYMALAHAALRLGMTAR